MSIFIVYTSQTNTSSVSSPPYPPSPPSLPHPFQCLQYKRRAQSRSLIKFDKYLLSLSLSFSLPSQFTLRQNDTRVVTSSGQHPNHFSQSNSNQGSRRRRCCLRVCVCVMWHRVWVMLCTTIVYKEKERESYFVATFPKYVMCITIGESMRSTLQFSRTM